MDFHAVRVTRAWAVAFAMVEPTHNCIGNSADQFHTQREREIYIYMYIGIWICMVIEISMMLECTHPSVGWGPSHKMNTGALAIWSF